MKATRIIIRGDVQGVSFRDNAKKVADSLNVKGYVENKDNGDVEIIATGFDEMVEELIGWCYTGPEHARVDDVETDILEVDEEFEKFEIRY